VGQEPAARALHLRDASQVNHRGDTETPKHLEILLREIVHRVTTKKPSPSRVTPVLGLVPSEVSKVENTGEGHEAVRHASQRNEGPPEPFVSPHANSRAHVGSRYFDSTSR